VCLTAIASALAPACEVGDSRFRSSRGERMFALGGGETADRIGLVEIASSSVNPAVKDLEDLVVGNNGADRPVREQVAP